MEISPFVTRNRTNPHTSTIHYWIIKNCNIHKEATRGSKLAQKPNHFPKIPKQNSKQFPTVPQKTLSKNHHEKNSAETKIN
jgi:hypothetical protein